MDADVQDAKERHMALLLREAIGDTLRNARSGQGRTLREVSDSARVSLGYLSEVERGRKEASSELLAAICGALDVPLSEVLSEVSARLAHREAAVAASQPAVTTAASSLSGIDVATKVVIPQVRAMAAA
jgi:transcriptional regulator with XRE-family HTH domain